MRYILLILVFIISLHAESINRYELFFNISQEDIKVKEVIDYNFEGSIKHGIFREIPTKININGKIINLHFRDFRVFQNGDEAEFKKYYKDGNIILKIGSKDRVISGRVRYKIKYKFDTPIVAKDSYDLISLNLIGTKWRVPIEFAKIYLRVNRPLKRDNINIKLYTGKRGSTSNRANYKWIDNHNLEIEVKNLKRFEGVTIDILAQKGLLKVKNSNFNYFNLLIGVLAGFLLFLIKRLKDKILDFNQKSISPTFLPPKDLSILESKLLLDGEVGIKDISAQIVQLATKGYIKIEKLSETTKLYLQNSNFENLTYDQKLLLNTLFANGDTFYINKENLPFFRENLYNIFKSIPDILIDKGYLKESPKKSKMKFFLNAVLITLPLIAYFLYTLFEYGSDDIYIVSLFPLIFGIIGIILFFNVSSMFERFFGLIFMIAGTTPIYANLGIQSRDFFGIIKEVFSYDITWLFFGFIILYGYIFSNINKIKELTVKGAEKSVQLLGLKEFISRVEADKINRLLKDDPNYLNNLLPWAMMFGYTKEFLKLYTLFNIATPSWYDGDIVSLDEFDNQFNSYYAQSSGSSSGFGGGGGSSGGGAGGGGGGSW